MLPGAGPLDAGTAEIGAIAGAGFLPPHLVDSMGVVGVTGRWAPGDRWMVGATGGVVGTGQWVGPALGVTVRGNFVQTPRFRAGLGAAVLGILPTASQLGFLAVTPVFAVEGGGAVRADLSVPFFPIVPGAQLTPGTAVLAAAAAVEGGVTFPLTSRTSLRVGKDVAGLGVALRAEGPRGGATTVRFATWLVSVGLGVEWTLRSRRSSDTPATGGGVPRQGAAATRGTPGS